MQTIVLRTNYIISIFAIMVSFWLYSCTKMSEEVWDKTAGMNGSFEVTQSGLPVNWLVYTPETIPSGDYELIIDTTLYKDGKQSLKFLVRKCSANGGWTSPGFCKEYEAIPGKTYKISFWVKNEGCEFVTQVGGVSPFEGEYETIIKSKENLYEWKYFEYEYRMPPKEKFNRIRFEMNILHPGTLWIDDIRIEDINGKLVEPTAS